MCTRYDENSFGENFEKPSNFAMAESEPNVMFLLTIDLCETLCSFSTDTARELDIFGHDRDSFSMDGTQVGIFEETYQVGFRSFLN